jgi:CheY-like chemotaxis protein
MTADIPPIVLLVDPHRESLECYSRHFETAGLWVAGTTAYDELLPSVEELHPDVIIADTDTDTARKAAACSASTATPSTG